MKNFIAILTLTAAFAAAPQVMMAEAQGLNTNSQSYNEKSPGESIPGHTDTPNEHENYLVITNKEVRGFAPSVKTDTA